MTPSPLSNYPRPEIPVTEPFRIWRGDLIFGIVGMLDLLPGTPKIVADILSAPNTSSRIALLVGVVALYAIVLWLDLKVIYRRRWAMWLLLGLSVAGLVISAMSGFEEEQRDIPAAISSVLEVVALVYLPLRLFGRVGPPPR